MARGCPDTDALWRTLNALCRRYLLLSKTNQIGADITQCGSQWTISEFKSPFIFTETSELRGMLQRGQCGYAEVRDPWGS